MASNDHRINVRLTPAEHEKWLALKKRGLSARDILEIVFGKVSDYPITVPDKINGAPVEIPRNIICQKKK